MIDQRRLPTEEIYNLYQTPEEIADAIVTMVIRGAPAIGVAAAMGIALGVRNLENPSELDRRFEYVCRILQDTRPTAQNLFWAISRMKEVFRTQRQNPLSELQRALRDEALEIQAEDIEINRRIGANGQALLDNPSTVLTHCNTGSLATAGYGTALGIVRAAVEHGKNILVVAGETRPFLQGARLTAWEMKQEGIPCTLITDSMAGYFMQTGRVNAVIVGADRIAANGDTANKIGTYSLAVLAKEHGIPFYVAAPLSTIDRDCPTGRQIPIEQRDPKELTHFRGAPVAPESIGVENPAFDVTPNRLISAIITEAGVARAPYGESLARMFER